MYNLIKIRTKYAFHSNSFLFACFSIVLECCKCARMRFHSQQFWSEYLHTLEGIFLTSDDAMQMDVHKALNPFCTTKEISHVTVTITKNASVTAIARYLSIAIRQFTQQAICRISTQGIFFQGSIAMICKERGMGLPWFSTKSQIMTLFYLPNRASAS